MFNLFFEVVVLLVVNKISSFKIDFILEMF